MWLRSLFISLYKLVKTFSARFQLISFFILPALRSSGMSEYHSVQMQSAFCLHRSYNCLALRQEYDVSLRVNFTTSFDVLHYANIYNNRTHWLKEPCPFGSHVIFLCYQKLTVSASYSYCFFKKVFVVFLIYFRQGIWINRLWDNIIKYYSMRNI